QRRSPRRDENAVAAARARGPGARLCEHAPAGDGAGIVARGPAAHRARLSQTAPARRSGAPAARATRATRKAGRGMPHFWHRLLHGTERHYARADWEAYVGAGWVQRMMDIAATDDFHAKQGRSTCRVVLERAGGRLAVYLKRHYRLPRWRGVLA